MHTRSPLRPLLAFGLAAVLGPMIATACRKKDVMTAQACDALATDVAKTLAAAATEGSRCFHDEDCVEARTARCASGCATIAVHGGEVGAFEDAVRRVEKETCERWAAERCAEIGSARPSCAKRVPRCRDGTCKMIEVLEAERCQELYRDAQNGFMAAVASADHACAKDEDCVLAGGPGCIATCGAPAIAATGKAAYDAALRPAAEKCRAWTDGDCARTTPQPIPTCPAYWPRCTNGSCTTGAPPPPRR